MARLLIEDSGRTITFERSSSDAKANRVLTQAALNLGYPGDPQDKQAVLDHVGAALVSFLVKNARSNEEAEAVDGAIGGVGADPPVWE